MHGFGVAETIRMIDDEVIAMDEMNLHEWTLERESSDPTLRLQNELLEAHGRLHEAESRYAALETALEELMDSDDALRRWIDDSVLVDAEDIRAILHRLSGEAGEPE